MKIMKNRYLGCPSMGGALFMALAVVVAFTPYWPASFVFFYAAVLALGCSKHERRKRMRREAERRWWIRQKRGVRQAPLSPCCLRYDETGFLHDLLCTRDRSGELPVQQEQFDIEWNSLLVAELGDLEREEGA